MACTCKNEDGSLCLTCRGTCKANINENTEMLINRLLSFYLTQIDNRIEKLEQICEEKYRDGIRHGIEIGKEIY